MTSSPETPQPAQPFSPPVSARVDFHGQGRPFVKLCLRGAVYLLFTFGFYRFWLATDIRRMIWSQTSLGGDRFEYTGRGVELLLGFLVALAIFIPIGLISFAAGMAVEQIKPFASLAIGLFSVLFGQFAIYRSRRYRLSRTHWRGVRLWADGSGWSYAFRWLGWAILSILTLGLALPWMRAHLEKYKMRHTHFGDLNGAFVGAGLGYLNFYWKFWLAFATPPMFVMFHAIAQTRQGKAVATLNEGIGLLAIAFPLLVIFLIPAFKAAEWRWWAQGARMGESALSCDLRGSQLLVIYLKTFAAMIALFAVAPAILFASLYILQLLGMIGAPKDLFSPLESQAQPGIAMIAAGIIYYLVLLLGLGVVSRYFLTFRMWGTLVGSLTIVHPERLGLAQASGAPADAVGEGLVDSLDIAF